MSVGECAIMTKYISVVVTLYRYSGIVTIGNTLLSTAQTSLVTAYQQYFGVKLAVVGSTGAGLSGITIGSQVSEVCICSVSH